jgi:carbamoyltransferase
VKILGISAYYHDSAAALLVDGQVAAAAQEERFTRRKHDSRFPQHAIRACLQAAGVRAAQIDRVAFYDKPFLKFERLLETYLAFAPRGFASFRAALPVWVKDKLFQRNTILKELRAFDSSIGWEEKLLFSEHHLSHAASAFYPSPFERAAVLTMDGVGEWTTTSLAFGAGRELKVAREMHFPHSVGLLYSAFTYYTGFKVNSGEYKVMGLAPYGVPRYAQRIREHLIDIKDDGSFRLNLDYFDYCTGLTMTNEKFDGLFGGAPRTPEQPLTQREMDLAASIQVIVEEVVLKLAKGIAREFDVGNLCLAGGVALNCVANGKLARAKVFERLWMQPAAGDAGGALGAALVAHHLSERQERQTPAGLDAMQGGYLGPEYPLEEIQRRLAGAGAVFDTLGERELLDACAGSLAEGKALGWFQGRMEFGPRALGARSILGDARSPSMQKTLNLKVKYRESFRPFAPAVLAEDANRWFQIHCESPYMLLVADVAEEHRIAMTDEQRALFGIDRLNVPRSSIPAVTHVDYSARVQTVHKETNPKFHELISSFKSRTGCPVIVNTSFNVRGEPIVCTPEDAFRCFMGTEIEALAVGNCFLVKDRQNAALKQNYESAFELD